MSAPPRPSAREVVQIAVMAVCLIAGIVLRFCAPPANIVGGGLIAVALMLLLLWGRAARGRSRTP